MVHFAFADARLAHDCIRCGSKCCRGFGFALPTEKLLALVARAPGVAPFAQVQTAGTHVLTFGDGCLLLADDGRCRLEVEHGHAAKPAVCRVFPLQITRLATGLVVRLQLRNCPLEEARGVVERPGVTVLRHATLAAELAELGADAIYPDGRLAVAAPDDALAREAEATRAVTALVDDGLSDPHQALLAAAAAHGVTPELTALRARWRRFFDIADDEGEALARRIAASFALALPTLRMTAMLAADAPPWHKLQRRLPAQLAAVACYAELAARERRPSLCLLGDLAAQLPLACRALARWDETVTARDAPLPVAAPAALHDAWATALAQLATRPLGEVLEATTLPPALRPALLRAISDRIF